MAATPDEPAVGWGPAETAGRRAHVVAAVIVLGCLVIAALILWGRAVSLDRLRTHAAELQHLRASNTVARVEDDFGDVFSILLAVSLNRDVVALDGESRDWVQRLFDSEHRRWRLSELSVVERDFDGTARPFMTFEPTGTPVRSGFHTLERESQEYRIQIEHMGRFDEDPLLQAQLSGEIDLCLPTPGGGPTRGLVYSVPIRRDGELVGLVAAMVPSPAISTILEQASISTMALVASDRGVAIGCEDFPPSVADWFATEIGGSGPSALVRTHGPRFEVEGYQAEALPLHLTADGTWWLFHLQRDHNGLDGETGMGPAVATAGVVVLIGLTLAALVRVSHRRVEERLQFYRHRRRSDMMLQSIVEGTSGVIGEEFLHLLARHIAEAFGVRYVLVGELIGESTSRVRTLAAWVDGALVDNFTYDLEGTPCANVANQLACLYPRGVQALFPEDRMLGDTGVESYLGTPLVGSQGNVLGVLAILDDRPMPDDEKRSLWVLAAFAARAGAEIERRRIDESRRRVEELYTSVVETIDEGIVVLDRALRYVYWNHAMEQITGTPRREALAWADSPWLLLPFVEATSVAQMMLRAATGAMASQDDNLYRRGDGAEGLASLTFYPLAATPGEVRGLVGVVREVTHEVRLEQRLRQAQKLEAIGTLAGGIAHDFNNILQVILGYAEMAIDSAAADSPTAQSLAEIQVAGRRGADLSRQILAFSRQTEKNRMPVRLTPLVKEIVALLRGTLPSTIEIRQRLDPGCGMVLGDPTQLHQVVMNLSTNAFHAMRETGGVLEVRLDEITLGGRDDADPLDLPPGCYARLQVRDTGHGMDEFTAARVFEPYFTTRKGGDGTGLGLSTVHGIVHSHGGTVTVRSEPGRGATFTVYLPIIDSTVQERAEGATAEPVRPAGRGHVLLVDDEDALVRLGSAMLERRGYQVSGFCDGGTALEVFRRAPGSFDLVLTDLAMPGMTGLEVARHVASLRPELPVVLMTGNDETLDRADARARGVRSFLMKPFSSEEIAAEIQSLLESPGTAPCEP